MAKLKPEVSDYDQSLGDPESRIVLVEFGDYQCPHCGHAHPLIKRLLRERGDDFLFVFRNFPLQESHPDALMAAHAAEAAAKQGKFWEMHDLIFDRQNDLDESVYDEFAEELGLDSVQLRADMDSDDILEKVATDFESGIRSGVNGTPTFFINGAIADYDTTYESLLKLIDSRISK